MGSQLKPQDLTLLTWDKNQNHIPELFSLAKGIPRSEFSIITIGLA